VKNKIPDFVKVVRNLVVHHINFEGEGLNRQDAKYAKEEKEKKY
jgi:hypothetical protein